MKLVELFESPISQEIDHLRNISNMKQEADVYGMEEAELQKLYGSEDFKQYKSKVFDIIGDEEYWYGPSQRLVMYGFFHRWAPHETADVIQGYGHPQDHEEEMDYTDHSMRQGELGRY